MNLKTENVVDVSGVTAGVYFVRIAGEEGNGTEGDDCEVRGIKENIFLF